MRPILLALLVAYGAGAATLSEAELKVFFEDVVPAALDHYHVPGAVVAVVKDGALVFAEGYGEANLDFHSPVDPAATKFRLASLSKLITATAVMQLVDQGKLALDEDVNVYLQGAWLPDYEGQPVTLRQLLTHTAGFDDHFLGMGAAEAVDLEQLGKYLRRRMPPRVFDPGEVISYSNHGVALAGSIVEEVSGQPFNDYVQEKIFDPLGMKDTYFFLYPDRLDNIAIGHDYKDGVHTPAPYDYPHTPPASSLAATAEDMARFMIAHLGKDPKLMSAESYETMHTAVFRHHPEMPGRAIGFAEADYNGRRILQHTGLIWGFSSLLLLMPDEDVGLFVSINTDATGAYGRIRGAFLDKFFPDARVGIVAPVAPEGSDARIAEATGAYLHSRRVRSSFLKFATVSPQFAQEIAVAEGVHPGEIVLSYPRGGQPARAYTEVSPWYFREVSVKASGERQIGAAARDLAFLLDGDGRPTHLTMDTTAYDRLPWYQQGNLLLGVLGGTLLIAMLHLAAWPLAWRRRRERDEDPLRWLRRMTTMSAILLVVFFAGVMIVMLRLQQYAIAYGPPPLLPALLMLPMVALVCALAAAFLMMRARLREQGTAGARVYYGAVTTAMFVLLALLSYWNLLGYRYG